MGRRPTDRLANRQFQVPIPAESILEDERSHATMLPASSFRRGFLFWPLTDENLPA
jgi:hypothetical protein